MNNDKSKTDLFNIT